MRNNSNYTTSYQRSGSIIFSYSGADYELRDQQYAKKSSELREVNDQTDLIHFYEELQADAISYNIFRQQFDALTPWAKYTTNTLPPTCILQNLTTGENTIDAYNRMKNALYTKLSKCTINDPEYSAIIKHGSIGKDGFEVLYELMALCHPKLMVAMSKIRNTNKRPMMTTIDSIYSYAEKLTTWLTIEQINGLFHTDDKVLNIIMEEMNGDTKYEIAHKAITSELAIQDALKRKNGNAPFPEHLKLYNLPSTVISFYTKEQRNSLFPHDNSTDTEADVVRQALLDTNDIEWEYEEPEDMMGLVQAIVKAASDQSNGRNSLARERIDELCEGCGMYGHNVYQTGCDRCAQYIMIKQYLENNPNHVRTILNKYKKHQKNIAIQRRNKDQSKSVANKSPSKKKRYNTRFNSAKVKKLQDAIFNAFNSDSEESNGSYTSAVESQASDTHHE